MSARHDCAHGWCGHCGTVLDGTDLATARRELAAAMARIEKLEASLVSWSTGHLPDGLTFCERCGHVGGGHGWWSRMLGPCEETDVGAQPCSLTELLSADEIQRWYGVECQEPRRLAATLATVEELGWRAIVERGEARRELEAALAWPKDGDQPLPEDEAIRAAQPTRTGRYDLDREALRLVDARSSKGGLVDLVNWLLAERDEARRDLTASKATLAALAAHVEDAKSVVATERARAEKAEGELAAMGAILDRGLASSRTAFDEAVRRGLAFADERDTADRARAEAEASLRNNNAMHDVEREAAARGRVEYAARVAECVALARDLMRAEERIEQVDKAIRGIPFDDIEHQITMHPGTMAEDFRATLEAVARANAAICLNAAEIDAFEIRAALSSTAGRDAAALLAAGEALRAAMMPGTTLDERIRAGAVYDAVRARARAGRGGVGEASK